MALAMSETPRMGWLGALWAGETPLAEAFWWYGIAVGVLVNAVATLVALGLATFDLPGWLLVCLFLLPTPYNLLVVVGVWRSAAAWQGAPEWAGLARVAILVWAAAAMLL
jgi:hypothetical protein